MGKWVNGHWQPATMAEQMAELMAGLKAGTVPLPGSSMQQAAALMDRHTDSNSDNWQPGWSNDLPATKEAMAELEAMRQETPVAEVAVASGAPSSAYPVPAVNWSGLGFSGSPFKAVGDGLKGAFARAIGTGTPATRPVVKAQPAAPFTAKAEPQDWTSEQEKQRGLWQTPDTKPPAPVSPTVPPPDNPNGIPPMDTPAASASPDVTLPKSSEVTEFFNPGAYSEPVASRAPAAYPGGADPGRMGSTGGGAGASDALGEGEGMLGGVMPMLVGGFLKALLRGKGQPGAPDVTPLQLHAGDIYEAPAAPSWEPQDYVDRRLFGGMA